MECIQNKIDLLKKQIDEQKYDIYVDSYPMSLIELINLYKEKDINLKADYQRVFKWTTDQKTKFIESLFLGLPIPSIFLYQDENALWEVVDGIQRLSTIFEFTGVLRKGNNTDETFMPLKLTEAPKLSYLEGLTYDDFSKELQREFKKFKLQLIIISKKSDQDVKLEVFRRLNGFGTKLNNQELRNALTLLLSNEYFNFIERLSNYQQFLGCFNFNDDQLRDKKHWEYIVRYLTLREEIILRDFSTKGDPKIDDLFDKSIIEIIKSNKFNLYKEEVIFKKVFNLLFEILGNNAFKKYYAKDGKFKNQIRESIFEVIIPGLSINIDYYIKHKNLLEIKVKELYVNDSKFEKCLAPNPKAIDRMKKLLQISKEHFSINE